MKYKRRQGDLRMTVDVLYYGYVHIVYNEIHIYSLRNIRFIFHIALTLQPANKFTTTEFHLTK